MNASVRRSFTKCIYIWPDNLGEKSAVCVRKDDKVVGHLRKRLMGRYAKTIFYFLRDNLFSKYTAKVVEPMLQFWGRRGFKSSMWTAHPLLDEIRGCAEKWTVKVDWYISNFINTFFYVKNAENFLKIVPRVCYIKTFFLKGRKNWFIKPRVRYIRGL